MFVLEIGLIFFVVIPYKKKARFFWLFFSQLSILFLLSSVMNQICNQAL